MLGEGICQKHCKCSDIRCNESSAFPAFALAYAIAGISPVGRCNMGSLSLDVELSGHEHECCVILQALRTGLQDGIDAEALISQCQDICRCH